MKIKVCGTRLDTNIKALAALPIDYIGFIFYAKSPRFVDASTGFNPSVLTDLINTKIKKVGVFVNENEDYILSKVADYQLDTIQLHGDETNDFIKNIKSTLREVNPFWDVFGGAVWKAISISDQTDFEKINNYPDADLLLLDTKTPKYGGSGNKFDWSLLEKNEIPKPFFLSGGIDLEDAENIKKLNIKNLYGIDINSKFEIEPALKDVKKVEQLLYRLL